MPAAPTRIPRRLGAGFLLLALALCGSLQGASALYVDDLGGRLPDGRGMKCYSRTFDKAHMEARPNQRVTTMTLVVGPLQLAGDRGPRVWPFTFVTRLKGEQGLFWQGGECAFEGGTFTCSADYDGGHVTLAQPSDLGLGLHLELSRTFVLQGGYGDRRKTVHLSGDAEEPSYLLNERDMKVCRSRIRASREALEWFNELSRKP